MRLKRFIYLLNYANLYICFLLKKPKVLYHISIRLLAFTFYLLSCRSAIYKFNRQHSQCIYILAVNFILNQLNAFFCHLLHRLFKFHAWAPLFYFPRRYLKFTTCVNNLHYEKFQDGTVKCIEDEIPFELPEGWAWERLGNVSTIARGGSPRPIEDYLTDNVDGIKWIKIGDTEKDGKYILHTKEKIKPAGLSKTRYVQSGDFLLTNSMSFGRPYILKTNGCIHDGWLVIGNIDTVFNQDYLYYALSSGFMYTTLSLLAAGSTVKNLKSDTVRSVLFPIPPFGEQERMARRLEQLIILVDAINAEKGQLVDIINQTKSKILDLAIRGKLVPQDPNDEPASVLLERIRSEKEELIKQGKIKRDKKESVIFRGDDNSYYLRTDLEIE